MTRTAKRGPDNKKKHEASDWKALKPQAASPGDKQRAQSGTVPKHTGNKKYKGKGNFRRPQTGEEQLLHRVLSKDHRREQRRQKRANERAVRKVCFKCRMPGHKVEECIMSDNQQGTGLCYRCGSTEHKSSDCKAKLPQGQMPFATCYVCGKTGHIAKSCQENPKGLYPKGGGCKTCGSVEHFQRDCSEYLEKQGIGSKKVKQMTLGVSIDAVDDEDDEEETKKQQQQAVKKKKPKVITF